MFDIDYEVNISYKWDYRAREYTFIYACELLGGSYVILRVYGKELKIANPGSIF